MSAKKRIETMMIELDCLLDTRFGTISKMGEDHLERIFTPAYLERDEDRFEGIDPQQFKEMYNARDEETLQRSVITAFVPRLKNLTQFLSESAIARPEYNGIKVAVNVYPYRLSESVLGEIRQCVSAWCGGFVPVELINIAPENLSPRFVKETFGVMMMYDYGQWFGKNKQAFNETLCLETHLIAPALYFNEKPDEKTLKDMIRNGFHPFQGAQMYGSQLIGLELVDVKYFSVVAPPHFYKSNASSTQSTTKTATA
jgi:hypothetical protein